MGIYGGKAAISLVVVPCIVVAVVVVAAGWSRLSLICTGFDIGTVLAKLVN
jgi:hypothetical protein